MNVLILSQYFWPEAFRINDVALGLTERGHDVTVLTGMPNYPNGKLFDGYGLLGPYAQSFNGLTIRRTPLIPRGSASGMRLAINYASHAVFTSLLAPFLVSDQIDGILVFEPSPITIGIPARMIKLIRRSPIAFWVQDLWPQSLSATGAVKSPLLLRAAERLTRWVYRGCDRVLVQSQAFIEHIEAQGVPRELIAYLPNSAESYYRQYPSNQVDRKSVGLPDGFRVMFAGNLGSAQDLPSLIAAAEMLRGNSEIQWIIVGEGRMRPWLADQIRAKQLHRTVHLIGQMPPESMPAYFAQADVLLASLRREPIFAYTIPSKIQSYLACGKPVIAALDGEGARIILEAGAGWATPPENPDELARTVLAASRLTKQELYSMGCRAEAFFMKNFEREMLLTRLERLLVGMKSIPA